jgi:hypothetical protein
MMQGFRNSSFASWGGGFWKAGNVLLLDLCRSYKSVCFVIFFVKRKYMLYIFIFICVIFHKGKKNQDGFGGTCLLYQHLGG